MAGKSGESGFGPSDYGIIYPTDPNEPCSEASEFGLPVDYDDPTAYHGKAPRERYPRIGSGRA